MRPEMFPCGFPNSQLLSVHSATGAGVTLFERCALSRSTVGSLSAAAPHTDGIEAAVVLVLAVVGTGAYCTSDAGIGISLIHAQ